MNQPYGEYRQEASHAGELYQGFVERVFRHYMNIELYCYKKQIEQYLIGENKAGIEIKHDRKFRKRNPPALWIEYAEKARPRAGDYAPSGIMRHDNSWLFVIGDYKTIFIFGIKTLRRFHKRNLELQGKRFKLVEWPTSRAFMMPVADALVFAEKVIEIDEDFSFAEN